MDMNKKDTLIAVGVVAGAAVLVLFLKNRNSASTGGNLSGGVTDIMGGFQTAGTIYVPTSSYDLQYNTYKGAVTYSTVTNNQMSTTTTTYAPVNSNNGNSIDNGNSINSPSGGSTVSGSPVTSLVSTSPAAGVSSPPIITTGSGNVVNPVQQPQPSPPPAPVQSAPPAPPPPPAPSAPAQPAWEGALVSGYHYATPAGGWNPGSIVDNMKSHGFRSSYNDQANLAAAMGIQGYQGTAAQNIQMLNSLKAVGL